MMLQATEAAHLCPNYDIELFAIYAHTEQRAGDLNVMWEAAQQQLQPLQLRRVRVVACL